MKDVLVSIIVPIYNSEGYLEVCLQSILAQTYRNIEILLIDDGSTDQSGAICDAYAARDSRIRVLHNTNHGVSYSRNCGIKSSKGAFLIFIDSDDSVNNTYVEGFMEDSTRYDLKISSICDIWVDKNGNKHISVRHIPQKNGNLKNDYESIIPFLAVPHSKLYRADIIKDNNILFPEGIDWAEDQIFNWRYCRYVNSYKFSIKSQYKYFHRDNNSLSQQRKKVDDIGLVKAILRENDAFLTYKGIDKKNQLICNRCIDYFMYAGSGYTLFKIRCELIRGYLAGKYSASNWKRWLVLKCIQYGWYKIIYVYYRLKWLKQKWGC